MQDIIERKKEARQKYRTLRNAMSDDYKKNADEVLFSKTVNCKAYADADTVLAFYPIKNEPDVLKIVQKALSDKKRVAFPISNTNDYTLCFKYVDSLDELVSGAYSIPEPKASAEDFCPAGRVLCLVPALAFDRNGRRIGYGKGFYDRFLAGFDGTSLGLSYDELLADDLPHEATDKKIDMIFTEKEEIIING